MLLGNVHLENEWMGEKNEWNIAQAKKDHLEKVIRSFKALPVLAKTVKYITSSFLLSLPQP